jgi:hypothetical protein
MSEPPASLPPAPPPSRRRPPPRPPVDITFVDASVPPPPPPPPARNSFYHVQKALMSPRVLAAVAAISGWAWGAAQYVAGSARQSDLDTAVLRLDAVQTELQQVKVNAATALTGVQQCVAQQGAIALTMRAIVGQIARQRGRTELQKRNEQAAAESRYSTAITDGKPPHEAARIALLE